MAQEREAYKERMRAAGRRALEDFRRQKGERMAMAAAQSSGTGPAVSPSPQVSVELATFRVYTQPAAAQTGLTRPSESSELRLLAPALASTSLGPLPPGSACMEPLSLPVPRPPSSSSPSTAASVIGTTSVCSLASSVTGFSAAPSVAAVGGSAGSSPPGIRLTSAGEDEEAALHGFSPGCGVGGVGSIGGGGGSGGGGQDQAMVDMLLGQVEALMRDKASLSAENVALRQQVEQLTELVGWLSLERGDPDGLDEVPEAGPGADGEGQEGEGVASRADSVLDSWFGRSSGDGDGYGPSAPAGLSYATTSGGGSGPEAERQQQQQQQLEREVERERGEADWPTAARGVDGEASSSGRGSAGQPVAGAAPGDRTGLALGGEAALTDSRDRRPGVWEEAAAGSAGTDPLDVLAGAEGGGVQGVQDAAAARGPAATPAGPLLGAGG